MVWVSARLATNGGFGSGFGMVSYGALRCESVASNRPSSSREGHTITMGLSAMLRPKPLRSACQRQPKGCMHITYMAIQPSF